MTSIPKGKLIVFEGLDGSGKTTQVKILLKRLKKEGIPVKLVDFPRYGKPSAAMVEQYLEGKFGDVTKITAKQASIFYACDRFAASLQMKKDLEKGIHLVADRYVSSNMAFQGGKILAEKKRQEFWDWNRELEYNIFGIPKPNKTIFLHLKPKTSYLLAKERQKKAGKKSDKHELNLTLLQRTEKTYLELMKVEKGWSMIECAPQEKLLAREDIHEMVWKIVKKVV